MANSGFKQATIAYKTDQEGNPVDINGQLISTSGRRQAIAVMEGIENPNRALYEIELTFNPRGAVQGDPTYEYSDDCYEGYLIVNPAYILFSPDNLSASVYINSSTSWTALNSVSGINLSVTEGEAGVNYIEITSTEIEAQGCITLTNGTLTTQIYVAYMSDVNRWILDTGIWEYNALWLSGGIWNF